MYKRLEVVIKLLCPLSSAKQTQFIDNGTCFITQYISFVIFDFLTATIANTPDPRHSAYAVLGPRHCPLALAYHSHLNF